MFQNISVSSRTLWFLVYFISFIGSFLGVFPLPLNNSQFIFQNDEFVYKIQRFPKVQRWNISSSNVSIHWNILRSISANFMMVLLQSRCSLAMCWNMDVSDSFQMRSQIFFHIEFLNEFIHLPQLQWYTFNLHLSANYRQYIMC